MMRVAATAVGRTAVRMERPADGTPEIVTTTNRGATLLVNRAGPTNPVVP
jgi:hypothetical protein